MTNNNEKFVVDSNKKEKETMLTTIDNPFSPFKQFDEWLMFDTEKKYFTYNYVDRIANTNESMTEDEKELAIQSAFKEIVAYNPDLYIIVQDDR